MVLTGILGYILLFSLLFLKLSLNYSLFLFVISCCLSPQSHSIYYCATWAIPHSPQLLFNLSETDQADTDSISLSTSLSPFPLIFSFIALPLISHAYPLFLSPMHGHLNSPPVLPQPHVHLTESDRAEPHSVWEPPCCSLKMGLWYIHRGWGNPVQREREMDLLSLVWWYVWVDIHVSWACVFLIIQLPTSFLPT